MVADNVHFFVVLALKQYCQFANRHQAKKKTCRLRHRLEQKIYRPTPTWRPYRWKLLNSTITTFSELSKKYRFCFKRPSSNTIYFFLICDRYPYQQYNEIFSKDIYWCFIRKNCNKYEYRKYRGSALRPWCKKKVEKLQNSC